MHTDKSSTFLSGANPSGKQQGFEKVLDKDIHTHTHTHTGYTSLDIPIFSKTYEFYRQLTQGIIAFPKTKRYTLGQKLDNITLEVFELLISVPNSNDKVGTLYKISNKIDLLKILLRLAKDTQAITNKNYLELQEMLQEIGKMLGGWIRATKQSLPSNKSSY